MPALKLSAGQHELPRFAIIAQQSAGTNIVRHVALLRQPRAVKSGDDVEVWHCGPPIVAGRRSQGFGSRDSCTADAVAYLEDLTSDEEQGIETELCIIEVQTIDASIKAAKQYVAHPPKEWICDPVTGVRKFRRFSCIGFVVECYEQGAGIRLLSNDLGDYPEVTREQLRAVYGRRTETHGASFGLEGDGPWRVMLAGYVLHALQRSADSVRAQAYLPTSTDERAYPV